MFVSNLEVREGVGGITEGRLGGNTSEGEHGKTSIGNLTGLHELDLLITLVLKEREGVKGVVTGLTVTLSLGNLNEDSGGTELDESNSEEEESHGSLFNQDIVGLVGGGDVLNRVQFTGEAKGDSESTVSGEPSEPSHHSNTGMLELGLTHPVKGGDSIGLLPLWGLDESGEILGDGGKVHGVKSNITRHGSIKVHRAGEEGKGCGPLGLVYHRIPHSVGHGVQGGGALASSVGIGGEGCGRTGEESGGDDGFHGGCTSNSYCFIYRPWRWLSSDEVTVP